VGPGCPVCGRQLASMVAPAPRPTRRKNSRRSIRSVIRSTAPALRRRKICCTLTSSL